MGDTRISRLRLRLFRKSSSATSSSARSAASSGSDSITALPNVNPVVRRVPGNQSCPSLPEAIEVKDDNRKELADSAISTRNADSLEDKQPLDSRPETQASTSLPGSYPETDIPFLTVEQATPESPNPRNNHPRLIHEELQEAADTVSPLPPEPAPQRNESQSPPQNVRRQSLVGSVNVSVVDTLLSSEGSSQRAPTPAEYFPPTAAALPLHPSMLHRKIWVKRPGASATLVHIKEDDLVDDVRDMILRKYANQLSRTFDSPDITLRIVSREKDQSGKHVERTLGPEEDMCRTLDAHYPGGQTIEDALLIEVPRPRTPKPSPRAVQHMPYSLYEDLRPAENATDYFPPMNPGAPSPAALTNISHHSNVSHPAHERAMSVLSTGQVPPLPSPGGSRRQHPHRPKYPRQHTSSPTQINNITSQPNNDRTPRPAMRPRHDSSASLEVKHPPPPAPPLPTPPPSETAKASNPPTPRVASPRPTKRKKEKQKRDGMDGPALPAGLMESPVPPINVLLVEDNIINLKILEQFMGRLKVRWQTAMNGQIAVDKWRQGGFHLVLMDIQLPIMSGLEATKEIRRLERVNNIGVFSNTPGSTSASPNEGEDVKEEDRLKKEQLFKSPVIIVALTASSLQSDRHEALAAGCNDFLTKPVNFVWMERKVKEWGCMQALIDFDGWRKWKDFAAQNDSSALSPKNLKNATNSPPPIVKDNRRSTGASAARANAGESSRAQVQVNGDGSATVEGNRERDGSGSSEETVKDGSSGGDGS